MNLDQTFQTQVVDWIISQKYLILTIIIFSFIPIVGIQLYFRHDDSAILLWAQEFNKPFYYAFHTDLDINRFAGYDGMGGYYRPFTYLYLMFMQDIFGNSPFFYQLLGGVMMVGIVVIAFKIAEVLSSKKEAAFLAVSILFILFYKIFYISYHIMTPFEYFLEMLCLYFGIVGIVKSNLKYLIIALLLIFPATTRQTAPLIFFAMIFIYITLHWKTVFPGKSITKIIILILSFLPILSIFFSSMAVSGSILNVEFSLQNYYSFLNERIEFYSSRFLTGAIGCIVFSIVLSHSGFVAVKKRIISLFGEQKQNIFFVTIISIVASIILAIFFKPAAPYVFMLILIIMFFLNKSIQLPVIWFFVSAISFFAIEYYHWGYFFEAVLALVIILGNLLYQVLKDIDETYQIAAWLQRHNRKIILSTVPAAITTLAVLSITTGKIPVVSNNIQAAKILTNTNKNFAGIMDYMVQQLPEDARVYELSSETLGLTMWQSRFLSMVERAENVKVMNIRDTRAMLKVLRRDDINLSPAAEIVEQNSNGAYFIACSILEMKKAREKYPLKLVKSFKRKYVEAAIYQLNYN